MDLHPHGCKSVNANGQLRPQNAYDAFGDEPEPPLVESSCRAC